jgi:serine/threonine protein kinase
MSAGSEMRTTIGPYRVIDFIGAGGMGAVYRVVHRTTGQIAAAKVLSASAVGKTGLERFRNEARIHRTLTHPNIARVHEYLELDNAPCLVMDFVDGVTLEDRLRREGPLALAEAVRVFSALADAVSYVHQRGIVHRDLKPNNVKLDSSGTVKLLDFGIAMAPGGPRLTSTGNVVGTLQSLAPEQLLTGRAEPRSDVWALGIVFYEMLTGVPPFSANAPGLLGEKILKGAYVPPSQYRPELHKDVDRIVARCLRVRPEDRYASAEALLTDLRTLPVSGESTAPIRWVQGSSSALLNTSGEMARTMAKQWRLVLSGGAAVVALAFLVWSLRSSPTPAPPAGGDVPKRPTAESLAGPVGPVDRPPTQNPADPMSLRRVDIRVLEGEAEVLRDGKRVGVTPYTLEAAVGSEVSLVLRRAGCDDTPIRLRMAEGMDAIMESMRHCRNQ